MSFQSLEHRIPPPVVAVAVGVAMWAVASFWPTPALPVACRWPLALVVALSGLISTLAGVISFRSARTTVNPLRPASASTLVTSGVYRITRNPMYVGLLMVLLAWAVFLSVPWALVGPLAFVFYMARFQIEPEERALAEVFGEQYLAYKQRVRRWL